MTTDIPTGLSPAAARSLETWHRLVEARDLSGLVAIVHPDASFRSPMSIHPYRSREALVLALSTVITIFEDFTYHRQFAGDGGMSAVLEFSARVGDRSVKGVDIIRFDDDGLITDFEVMIRPLNGLQALGAEMGARLGALMPAFKGRE